MSRSNVAKEVNRGAGGGHPLGRPGIRVAVALACCFLWGCAFPCLKLGYEWLEITTVGGQILFAGYRFTLAGIAVFVAGCIMRREIIRIPKGMIGATVGIGFVQTTLEYLFFYIGLANLTGSEGAITNAMSTFVAILMAHFLVKGDRITARKFIGCLIGFGGVVITNTGGITAGFSLMGEGMMLLAAASYGAGSVLTKMVSHKIDPVVLTAYQLTFGGAILIVIGLLSGGRVGAFDGASLLLFMYMVFISAVAFGLWTALLKYNKVSQITVFNFSIPLFGVLLSALFLGENVMSPALVIALILVSLGIGLANTGKGGSDE